MDSYRFDSLTRSLTTASSRRDALASLLGGTLGLLGLADAAAKDCKKIKDKKKRKTCLAKAKDTTSQPPPPPIAPPCPEGKRLCNGACIPSNQCCTDGDCPASTPTCCGGGCVSVLTDLGHCGRCGAGCGFNEQCSTGVCRCGNNPDGCPTGKTCCGASCTCGSNFMIPATCAQVTECPAGSTPCTASTGNCSHGLPGRACCPAGTRCDEGTCRYV